MTAACAFSTWRPIASTKVVAVKTLENILRRRTSSRK
jgi:hypothetical protein